MSAWHGRSRRVVIVAGACSIAGCFGCDDGLSNQDAAGSTSSGSTSTGDAGAPVAGPELKKPSVKAPPGWHLWPYPPEDCAIFVPDDLATVEAPVWQPCPFMPDGCTETGAPWAAELGLGYGGPLTVGIDGRHTDWVMTRRVVDKNWLESFLVRDDQIVGAWRFSTEEFKGSLCVLHAPRIHYPGRTALHVVRVQAENSPYVFVGAPETLVRAPERVEIFGPPDSALIPWGRVLLSTRLLTFQTYNDRFAVRDLLTGETYRPYPPDQPHNALRAVPVNDSVFYEAWTGIYSSIWVETGGVSVPLLRSDSESHNQFVTDGTDAAWQRGVGYVDTNLFQTIELWTSPLSTTPEGLAPRKLVTLPINVPDPPSTAVAGLSIGEGWVAAWLGLHDVRLYRISDGLERRLPVIDNLVWSGTDMYDGMVIAGGALWMKTSTIPGAGNDIKFIHRFEIDKLPVAP